MRRVPMFVAASVTTAMIALGVNAIAPVGAQENPGGQARSDLVTRFADCLRDRGVTVPALHGAALDRWLKTADVPLATGQACKTALSGVAAKGTPQDDEKLVACLRGQGLTPPSDQAALKAWIARQDKAAIQQALDACDVGRAAPAPCDGASHDKREIVEHTAGDARH